MGVEGQFNGGRGVMTFVHGHHHPVLTPVLVLKVTFARGR